MKKNIGVVVAIEIDSVLEKYGSPKEVIETCGYRVLMYENEDCRMYFLDSGAGEIASAGGTQVLISEFKADVIMNFGVVGALTEDIKTAELCVVEAVADIDFGSDGWLNLKRGQHPGEESVFVKTDENLLKIAMDINPKLTRVKCASTNSFRDDAKDKLAIREAFGADICEMEAAGILRTCKRAKVPCLLIKAVSDSLMGGGTEFFASLQRVSLLCFEMLDLIIKEIK